MREEEVKELTNNILCVEKVYKRGETIVKEGEKCDYVYIFIEGIARATSTSDDKEYSITEMIGAPYTIQPERAFGITQYFTRSFKALNQCTFILLPKKDVLNMMSDSFAFRMNILNNISTNLQRYEKYLWLSPGDNTRQKIVRFLQYRLLRPAGEIEVHIKMQRLAEEINESRVAVSKELHKMAEENIAIIQRNNILIHAFQELYK